ncbi:aminoglycoside phosphotransferase [Kineococcus radiotolerans]|uniref:aminoglycoside phosphotransferase n=1 Tax=Kineococcus radiotolerans TaxID=131568 RepID=UPI00003A433F|nr:aminoglycoside phosphotransferase [Kineococcus radiotolerans]
MAGFLGGPPVVELPAAAGFTASIASTVVDARGRRLFIKAAALGDGMGEAVEAGAALANVVGDLGPQLRGSMACGSWRVAAYEVLDGATVSTWRSEDLPALLKVVKRMRARLDPSPTPGITPFAEAFTPLLGTWQALAAGPAPGDPGAVTVEHVRGRPLPVDVAVEQLAELESRWLPTLMAGAALHHGDLRRDNVMREPGGRLRIVDWTHRWSAPGWLDLVRLAPDVAADGHDPQELLETSCWADAPADAVNVALAGLAGRCWREGHLPEVAAIPGLRVMQREQGLQTLRWLEQRLTTPRR